MNQNRGKVIKKGTTAGERLRILREEILEMSRPEFSAKIGISTSRLTNVETKKQRMHDVDFEAVCTFYPWASAFLTHNGEITNKDWDRLKEPLNLNRDKAIKEVQDTIYQIEPRFDELSEDEAVEVANRAINERFTVEESRALVNVFTKITGKTLEQAVMEYISTLPQTVEEMEKQDKKESSNGN